MRISFEEVVEVSDNPRFSLHLGKHPMQPFHDAAFPWDFYGLHFTFKSDEVDLFNFRFLLIGSEFVFGNGNDIGVKSEQHFERGVLDFGGFLFLKIVPSQ